jgi:hypothetical protein
VWIFNNWKCDHYLRIRYILHHTRSVKRINYISRLIYKANHKIRNHKPYNSAELQNLTAQFCNLYCKAWPVKNQ